MNVLTQTPYRKYCMHLQSASFLKRLGQTASLTHRNTCEYLLDVFGFAAEEVGHDEGEQRHELDQVVL